MQDLIGCAVASIAWTDGLFVFNDGSTDGSVVAAVATAQAHKLPIHIESSSSMIPAFARGEAATRNYVITRAFDLLRCDTLVILDADEMMSETAEAMCRQLSTSEYSTISLSTWNLYTEQEYLHFRDEVTRGVLQVDPHIRIVQSGHFYRELNPSGLHSAIELGDHTLITHGPHHFHLKYFDGSPFPNYAWEAIPKYPSRSDLRAHLRPLPFTLPSDVKSLIRSVPWGAMQRRDLDYYERKE